MPDYKVVKWNNDGLRIERDADDIESALHHAKLCRTMQNRTIKVVHLGNTLRHWNRTLTISRNHWTARAVADE